MPFTAYQRATVVSVDKISISKTSYISTGGTIAGCPLFSNTDFPRVFHDQKMKIHDLSAQLIFQSKWYTTYKCIPELVVTVPAARSTIVKKIISLVYLHIFTQNYMTLSSFSMTFHDLCYFPWLFRPRKWSSWIPRLSMTWVSLYLNALWHIQWRFCGVLIPRDHILKVPRKILERLHILGKS